MINSEEADEAEVQKKFDRNSKSIKKDYEDKERSILSTNLATRVADFERHIKNIEIILSNNPKFHIGKTYQVSSYKFNEKNYYNREKLYAAIQAMPTPISIGIERIDHMRSYVDSVVKFHGLKAQSSLNEAFGSNDYYWGLVVEFKFKFFVLRQHPKCKIFKLCFVLVFMITKIVQIKEQNQFKKHWFPIIVIILSLKHQHQMVVML